MPKVNFGAAAVFAEIKSMVVGFQPSPNERDPLAGRDCITPLAVRDWLARLRLLEAVPFNTIVADSDLLPKESIRFFYVDRAWTDALIQGALSVGTVNSGDRAQLQSLYPAIREEIDAQERLVRRPSSENLQLGQAAQVTGMLLRSRAVSGWPGLQVRAYSREVGPDDAIIPESNPDRVKLLRLERLAPAVLLALFDGVPQVVHVEEPRQGIQFGIISKQEGDRNSFSAKVTGRDVQTAQDLVANADIPISFRPGAPGVIDLHASAAAMFERTATHIKDDGKITGAEFALQMIRFPFRQVFGDPTHASTTTKSDVFRPSIALDALLQSFKDKVS